MREFLKEVHCQQCTFRYCRQMESMERKQSLMKSGRDLPLGSCTYPTAVLTSTFTFSPPPLMEISLSAQREAQMDAEGKAGQKMDACCVWLLMERGSWVCEEV
ncbi:unnamed protein product [Leuciscus chuanchicus]